MKSLITQEVLIMKECFQVLSALILAVIVLYSLQKFIKKVKKDLDK